MSKVLIALVGIAALIASVAPASCFSWPATQHVTPLFLSAANIGVSQTLPSYAGKNPVLFLMLAADKKNGGGQKDGDDTDKAEKDDKSQDKDKDGGGGWDRLWDSPMLG